MAVYVWVGCPVRGCLVELQVSDRMTGTVVRVREGRAVGTALGRVVDMMWEFLMSDRPPDAVAFGIWGLSPGTVPSLLVDTMWDRPIADRTSGTVDFVI